jgi:hypothetical protein
LGRDIAVRHGLFPPVMTAPKDRDQNGSIHPTGSTSNRTNSLYSFINPCTP